MVDLIRVTLGATALFLLPGYALLALARRKLDFDAVEALCLALGLSLAAIPLALYLTTLLGIRQGPGLLIFLLMLCAAMALWDWRRADRPARAIDAETKRVYALLALTFLFTLAGRLWSVRGIDFPLWTDPYAHTVIAQLIVDTGSVPRNYEPYAPIHDFTYHFGFHALAAWFHWLTGLSVSKSLVLSGQILNALVVPTTYIFVQRLLQNRGAGLAAAIIAGLLSHMPVQFVNWGRYTQLDGQMLLPVAMVLYITVLHKAGRSEDHGGWRLLLLTALAFAGLFFAHYRIFVFGALLAAILFGFALLWPQGGGRSAAQACGAEYCHCASRSVAAIALALAIGRRLWRQLCTHRCQLSRRSTWGLFWLCLERIARLRHAWLSMGHSRVGRTLGAKAARA